MLKYRISDKVVNNPKRFLIKFLFKKFLFVRQVIFVYEYIKDNLFLLSEDAYLIYFDIKLRKGVY